MPVKHPKSPALIFGNWTTYLLNMEKKISSLRRNLNHVVHTNSNTKRL